MSVDPKRPTGELLAAYVDGVGELDVEERRRVERYLASDPAAREEQAATRKVIDQLRELEPEAAKIDWSAMERAIHAEVGDEVPRRSFWYRWRFALPAFGLAIAAAIVFLVIRAQSDDEASPIAFVPKTDVEQPVFAQHDERVTVYLDGIDLEIAIEDAEAADDELDDFMFAGADLGDDEAALGFLEPTDLGFIDELDDEALARAERLLDRPYRQRKGS